MCLNSNLIMYKNLYMNIILIQFNYISSIEYKQLYLIQIYNNYKNNFNTRINRYNKHKLWINFNLLWTKNIISLTLLGYLEYI